MGSSLHRDWILEDEGAPQLVEEIIRELQDKTGTTKTDRNMREL